MKTKRSRLVRWSSQLIERFERLMRRYQRLSAWGRLSKGKARMAIVFQDGEHKSEFYKARAQEFRVLADNAAQNQSRETFLGLARTYEQVAQLAAEREARQAMSAGEAVPGP